MDTTSLWHIISSKDHYQSLEENIEVDVAIIGGGITGVTAALQLIEAGKRVAILEAHHIGGMTTSCSTGNLYIATQPYYQKIIKKFNLDIGKQVAHSRRSAIDFIEKTVNEKKIHCNFSRRPWFAYTNDKNKIAMLEMEVKTFQKMGVAIDYVNSLPLPFEFKKAAMMHEQARFNPMQYVVSLAAYLKQRGCLIYENTRIIDIVEKELCALTTDNRKNIVAKDVIMATHTPPGVNITQLFTAPYRSYVVAVKLKDSHYPEGHFWDLDSPHHAICTHAISESNQPELLMVAGNHHKVGQDQDTNKNYQALQSFLREHLSVSEVAYEWSSQHYQSADDIPYIGLASRFAKHSYLATGFFADGLVYGTLAGIIISNDILKKQNEWRNTYQAERFKPLASCCFLVKENANYIAQYYKDFPKRETSDFDDLQPGQGRVVEMEGEKWAVYKDEEGKLHVVSAVCTHMKCLVNFNDAEKSWDCPCHGSRFTTDGKVIEGPALKDLKKKEKV